MTFRRSLLPLVRLQGRRGYSAPSWSGMSTDRNNRNHYCENNVGLQKQEEEEESLLSVEFSEGNVFFSRGGEREAKGEESSGSGPPPPHLPCVRPFCLFFFPQLCRLLTERKVCMKSPELTEISAKHTFTGLQYLSISQSEVVVVVVVRGGTNSSCAKSNYARRCNVTAHKRLSVHPAVGGWREGGGEKKNGALCREN